MTRAVFTHVTGVVQGVGFRPFVYSLAERTGVAGWVLNSSEGVFAHAEGPDEAVDAFVRGLREDAPPVSVVDEVVVTEVDPEGLDGFEIRASQAVEGERTLVSPDIATCAACEAELVDPADRRFGYPFVNCTNCGPRFTIIEDIPYDRPMTTMADFPMCEECAREYEDPSDRRFHAQPNACPVCGPRLFLDPSRPEWEWTTQLETVPRTHREAQASGARDAAILDAAANVIEDGGVLAVKGLGGFQLACDATAESAVARLRERKRRRGKPLAVMVPDLEAARALCELSEREERLLSGTERPIVLARRRVVAEGGATDDASAPGSGVTFTAADGIAPSVADPLPELGIMLPYTPLHHLLLRRLDRPLVMTSGNLSEEPIAAGNAEALERLDGIADAFLMHDRGIHSRYDDSVVRVHGTVDATGAGPDDATTADDATSDDAVESIRRARGYAPYPLRLPFRSDTDILAVGPEQKHTFCLVTSDLAFVSQHIGDLENVETMDHLERTLELYERLFRVEPALVAHDLHPEYLSTKYALTLDLPRVGVQHHHAHIAGVAAEHGIETPVIGVAFDGTGYGTDGHIWGGEILVSRWDSFDRFAHLKEVPLPGGAAAVKRPARMAVGELLGLEPELLAHPGAEPLRERLADGEERVLREMVQGGVNCPPTSSMGRLFDAAAALAGVRDDARYEGQAAIEFEALADADARGAYRFELTGDSPVLIDQLPVLEAVLDDIAAGTPVGAISERFHRAVVDLVVRVAGSAADAAGVRHVALSGGVFMNRRVRDAAVAALHASGLSPLTHLGLPSNDGGVSFGQAVVAWSRRSEI